MSGETGIQQVPSPGGITSPICPQICRLKHTSTFYRAQGSDLFFPLLSCDCFLAGVVFFLNKGAF